MKAKYYDVLECESAIDFWISYINGGYSRRL
jgi:hypothetical protein